MKIHDVKQGSPEWLKLRAGIPTASEVGTLVVKGKKKNEPWVASDSKGVQTYAATKLAEWFLGRPLDDSNKSFAMDRGSVLEDEALPKFELETGLVLERVGFVTTDDGLFGCSPDSLIKGSGLECKSPLPQTHVKYLLAGTLPDEYFGQVQASMLVTGADHWWFESYCPGFPELIISVPRDDEYLAVLADALAAFQKRLELGKANLIELNGGIEPIRREITEEEAAGVVKQTMAGISEDVMEEYFQ